MSENLTVAKYESLSGIAVELTADTVRQYLCRGNGKITDQEVAFFIRTCQAKQLDPLENGEVYLIKYDDKAPAQIVVGKHAYLRRADKNPEYRGKKSGIVVYRDGQVVQKEGCCVYKVLNEQLIGGWCRVYRERNGSVEEFYREVALEEYSTGKSNWGTKPSTMIEKVAVAQCLRDAFPNDYEGLYTVDEMKASGAIPADFTEVETKNNGTVIAEVVEDPVLSQEQRKSINANGLKTFGKADWPIVLKKAMDELGIESTYTMHVSQVEALERKIAEVGKAMKAEQAEVVDDVQRNNAN